MTDRELIDIVREKSNIIIWGNSDIGRYTGKIIKRALPKCTVVFCDSDSRKQTTVEENKVISPQEAAKIEGAFWVLTSANHQGIMREQLMTWGVLDDQVVFCVTEEAKKAHLGEQSKMKQRPLAKLQFEVDITSHCNLDCSCCSQFAPLAEKEFVDVAELERDFSRLSNLFNGEVERLYLIGGEPLLHPEIIKCISLARSSFSKGKIYVFTNGLLLKQMSDEFWKACKENDVEILVTKYPIKMNYDDLTEYAKKKGVKFTFFGSSEDFKYMSSIGLDIKGSQPVEESFALCNEANNCLKLKHGRIYTCTRPAAIYKFNHFFGTNLQESELDSIDIYTARSGQEILEFVSRPIPFCRYCNNRDCHKAREWSNSEKLLEEWII